MEVSFAGTDTRRCRACKGLWQSWAGCGGGNRSVSGETGRGPGAERGGCDRERAGGGVHGVPGLRAGGSAPASGSVGAEAGSGGPN